MYLGESFSRIACNYLRLNSKVKLAEIYTPLRPVNAREEGEKFLLVDVLNEVSVDVNKLIQKCFLVYTLYTVKPWTQQSI